ncbi:lipid-A-disaccharide synthase [Inquilinus ginsengisoli]|uniref:Lipid-A-disaccharide synthase n=1 Tax=Inquilinus ginsengisoli TaxID=363840 RepID=A0ABU1JTN5_9PROT|nr:lipid-A-disaccharide synthase [Inquilinus ginsengisoli]MDR6291344.1 lipid-A-disaccharide synthase [Inquilinus ginsengisoli]
MASSAAPHIFLVATEPSGDLMGASLMAALRRRCGDGVRFSGVGGARMAAEGLDSLFPLADIAVMGAVELVPQLPRLFNRIRRTAEAALAAKPDALVSIDGLAFNARVAARLAGRAFPIVHFVAPKVWAWRPGRARKLAGLVDHLMVQLPFEPPWFERYGLPTTYVGHPIIETAAGQGDGARFRQAHDIAPDARLLTVLPGSRRGEVQKLLPVFGEALQQLAARHPGLRVAVPTVETVAHLVRAAAQSWPGEPILIEGDGEKYDAFAGSDAALAASGTVALELGMARVPSVIAYLINPLTAFVVRRLLTTKYANLVNIMLDRPAVPELLQENCTPDKLAAAIDRLLTDPAAVAAQREAYAEVARMMLLPDGAVPGDRAADVVLDVIRQGRRPA